MNEGIHLDLDTWIVPGQIRKANLCMFPYTKISIVWQDVQYGQGRFPGIFPEISNQIPHAMVGTHQAQPSAAWCSAAAGLVLRCNASRFLVLVFLPIVISMINPDKLYTVIY